jgi:hypothetical protein
MGRSHQGEWHVHRLINFPARFRCGSARGAFTTLASFSHVRSCPKAAKKRPYWNDRVAQRRYSITSSCDRVPGACAPNDATWSGPSVTKRSERAVEAMLQHVRCNDGFWQKSLECD